jgi:LysM repeat protein
MFGSLPSTRLRVFMHASLALAAAVTPVLSLGLWSSLPGIADNATFDLAELPPLPALSPNDSVAVISKKVESSKHVWFQVVRETSLKRFAELLKLDYEVLASLNNVPSSHVFEKESWLSLPDSERVVAVTLSSLNRSSERQTLPMVAPPPVTATAKIKSGDSLASFLKRHGMTQKQLLSWNPGLQLSALTIGQELQIAEASSSQSILAVRPLSSGDAAWPERPVLSSADQPDSLKPPIVGYQWPTKGVFTSGYGWRWGRMHKGIDIANNTGTPVVAARDGIVSFSGWRGAYGYLVEIAHSDGEFTRYAHNSRLLVKKGQIVPRGSRISLMGSTGRSTGPHLHFEIRRAGGAALNPLVKLPARKA